MAAPTRTPVVVRSATADDLPFVADIYRHYVDNTVATFDFDAPTVADWSAKLTTIAAAGRPFLVAETVDDGVIGFAYLGEFRSKSAYAQTTEDTIYVRHGLSARGVGSALLSAVIAATDPANVRQIIAVIAAESGDASVALHRRHGFDEVGRLAGVGRKFDRWVDVVYMQLEIS
ncbi:N-acetyltransferase [Gordonia sp. TBRC 11910]|uniref:N-acetyltransferase n=1 Tax=Gordonia asplenii TaxID=2725283 RepID=A0A848L655_9ACTN|nr:GNAT family N-acetyltransferase [Gordonia asplenii]NMO04021.1 N-acetyltransferase [Gordonia asplenii]